MTNRIYAQNENTLTIDTSNLVITGDASFNSNVDVSGDLYVKATSTLSTVKITKSLNVSGNASFGNVDINTLTIDSFNGDVGAVLTSQGASNPIWEQPYFMLAGLYTSYNQSENSGTEVVKDMEERFNGSNYNYGNWSKENNCWICPANGFYKITGAIRAASNNIGELRELNVIISKYHSNNDFEEDIAYSGFYVNYNAPTTQSSNILTANTTTIIYLTASERIKLRVNWLTTDNNFLIVKGILDEFRFRTRPEKTYLMVERIIKGTF